MFNLKNKECQETFSEVTENHTKLKKCFKLNKPFPEQCNNFFKTLDDIFHQCFRKIRTGKKETRSEIQELLESNQKMKISQHANPCKLARTILQNK